MIKQLKINKMKNLNYKAMRKFAFTLLMLLALSMNAQDLAVKFLDIPVDGTKSEMISKLKDKGYAYNSKNDCLTGKFNGENVIIKVLDYKGKVYRIVVADASASNARDIIIKYNNLMEQFERSGKYEGEQERIDYQENLYYEMSAHNKTYETLYWQKSDTDGKPEDCELNFPYNEATDEFIEQFHSNCIEYAKSVGEDYYEQMYLKGLNEIQNLTKEQMFEYDKNWMKIVCITLQMTIKSKRMVWFRIVEDEDYFQKFRIILNYENGYNMPNGEDL